MFAIAESTQLSILLQKPRWSADALANWSARIRHVMNKTGGIDCKGRSKEIHLTLRKHNNCDDWSLAVSGSHCD